MLNITEKTIVYVLCPPFNKTGGTELAHQLVYAINLNGLHAKIAYYDKSIYPMEINDAFKIYVDNYVNVRDIVDLKENIVITPEIDIKYLKEYKNIQKCIWWMSVDNFYKAYNVGMAYQHYGLFSAIKGVLKRKLHWKKPSFPSNITHFYQSEYAKQFLIACGVKNPIRLSDYLNSNYLNLKINTDRENRVLYNPAKGFSFTKELMKYAPDIQWVPLQNMTTEQVKETLLHSKVYIDFGNHPGKDRFPREAAMCGCCVITGKRGSAKFFEDVPIAGEFKFGESKGDIPAIISKIRECLHNYEAESLKFDGYREFIKGEFDIFNDDVKNIFRLSVQ